MSQSNYSHKTEIEKLKGFNDELDTQKVVMIEQINFLKSQQTKKDEEREIYRNEKINMEEQVEAFERQQEEME